MGKLEVELGKKIRELRKQKGYTQAELAELVDLSTNFIGYLERGKQLPSLKTLEKIAQALGITIGYLFYSIENTLHKPTRLTKKDQTLSKLSKHLKDLDIKDITLILRLTKRISKKS